MFARINEYLFRQVDASSIAAFRIGFGAVLLFDCLRYLWVLCIDCFYHEPRFFPKYYGFEWVSLWPENGGHLLFIVLAILSMCITLGFLYRISIVIFTVLFTYMFLLDQSRYLNHFYMVLLFCTLLCFIPAHCKWSIDAFRKPDLRSETIPYWCIFVLVMQLEIILIYAGLVKINADWLNLEPLRMWLALRADMPIVGSLFTQNWSVAVAAYGVILLHILGAPLLFFKATRVYVLGVYALFHTLNHFVFSIGIFPWMTLYASLLFFDPDWPKQVIVRLRNWTNADIWQRVNIFAVQTVAAKPLSSFHVFIMLCLCVWLSVQVLVPLRHFVYPDEVSWNEEGHRFSWRMKLRSKRGTAKYIVEDGKGQRWVVNPTDYLNAKQTRKMACIPDMILQFAHFLDEEWQRRYKVDDPIVKASVYCSLNGRDRQRLIKRDVDLSKVKRTLGHNDWITELKTPLKDPFLGQ